MWKRLSALVRAQLAGQWYGERAEFLPIAPLIVQGFLASVLCWVAADLPPYGYAIVALSIPLALTTLPLLGELGPLLRADPAAEWVGALPVRPFELRAARVAILALLLGSLALASLLPAALLAPEGMDLTARGILVLGGLVQTALVAALLLWIQALFGNRAESVLVIVQTLLFCGVVVGAVIGLRFLPQLAQLETLSGSLLFYPPAWFASFSLADAGPGPLLALSALILALITFALAPFPPAARARRANSALAHLLAPFRLLATRFWLRPEERGPFDLVYDGLPAERDFVVRTYPLVAVPLAFVLLGAQDGSVKAESLLAILLFTPAMYLPVLLVHVPATATPRARWLIDTAPLPPEAERSGALKAIAVRFLLPLYLGLALVAWAQSDLGLVLRLGLPGAVAGLIVLRLCWSICVTTPPMSTGIHDLSLGMGGPLTSTLLTVAVAMMLLSIAVWHFVQSPLVALGIAALAIGFELARTRRGAPPQATG